jgi:NAD-dependent dihydropyrimidine dehydrogenase PreA subunit
MPLIVDSERCTGCGLCVAVCPVMAVSLIEGKASIDQTRCDECLQCIEECPENAIHQIPGRDLPAPGKTASLSLPPGRTVHHAGPTFPINTRSPRTERKGGGFLEVVKKVIDSFLNVDPSFGPSRGKRRGVGRVQRQRRRGGRR